MRKFNECLSGLLTENGIDIEIFQEEDNLTYPYSLQARIATYLVAINAISYDEYKEMYADLKRRNPYLKAFEMAPRTFGETWMENKILELFPFQNGRGLIKATKARVEGGSRTIGAFPGYRDPLGKVFKSQFDFICYNGAEKYKVEVKACRANAEGEIPQDNFLSSSLTSRAYTYSEAVNENFQFHFQQLKPGFCDVFILVGVCTDRILYWILTSDELRMAGGLSPQHPTTGTKNISDSTFEGQVYKTIADYEDYLVEEDDILNSIIKKFTEKE